LPPVLPTVDQVAALLRARTQDQHDDEIGTFTSDTRPTDEQVEALIVQASSVVYGTTGSLDDLQCSNAEDIQTQSAHWIALFAAMLVELSYFPEQVDSDRSAFQYYKELWDAEVGGFKSYTESVTECIGGEVDPTAGVGIPNPSFSFPVDAGGMVGWQTRW
jgi:hypothetical protein